MTADEIETPILDNWLGPFRFSHGLASKRWRDRKVPILLRRNGQVDERQFIPVADFPTTLVLPFAAHEPTLITTGIGGRVHWKDVFLARDNDKLAAFRKRHLADDVFIEAHIPAAKFVRFLAKIAHGVAISQFGFTFEPLLLDVIEGTGFESASLFIGAEAKKLDKPERPRSHIVRTRLIHVDEMRIIAVSLQFFCAFPTPPYLVLAGLFEAGTHPEWEGADGPTSA